MAMQALALEARIRTAAGGNPRKKHRLLRCIFLWLCCVANPRAICKGLAGYVWYLRDWRRYRRLPGSEKLRWIDSMPQVHDRTATTPFDAHYFYLNGWAMRRIVALAPPSHVDIGSAVTFASLLAAVTPVYFVDYRPLPARCAGMEPIAGDIASLPFASGSAPSLSCLHVAEHIGLGRYGDSLDPAGTLKAAAELARVLAPGGTLYFSLPVGRPHVAFNAHRVHDPREVPAMFADLRLDAFAGVDDSGRFHPELRPGDLAGSAWGCGLYRLIRG
jgi:hypothetical protein